MTNEADRKRAQAMKDGPNSIVEDISTPSPRGNGFREIPSETKARDPADLEPCPLTEFLVLEFGAKHDQCAGFAYHARSMSPRTIPEWRAEFVKFMAKPIK